MAHLATAMNPQMTDRVRGKDGKAYLVSTMRYNKIGASDFWRQPSLKVTVSTCTATAPFGAYIEALPQS